MTLLTVVQEHKADQNIICRGCHTRFTRAGNYIEHLENGRCRMTNPIGGITRREFIEGVQQKHVVKEIMKNPGEFMETFQVQTPPGLPDDLISEGDSASRKQLEEVDGAEPKELEGGGVSVLDQEDPNQKQGFQPMEAEFDLMDANPQPYKLRLEARSNQETWPRLPGQSAPLEQSVIESLRSMSVGSPAPSISASEMSASEYASTITSRRGGLKIISETDPSSPIPPASEVDFSDAASDVTTTAASVQKKAPVWNSGSISQHLFKDAKATPATEDWLARQAREEQAQSKNMLYARFWDKTSADYSIKECVNEKGQFACPMPGCGVLYEEISDLEGHLLNGHVKRNWRCPLCLKIFQTAHALISHSEAGGKCKVKETSYYDQMLDEISGGFLQAEQLRQPKVYNTAALMGNDGKAADGVMGTKFEALMPGE